jgi:hypothetical protein
MKTSSDRARFHQLGPRCSQRCRVGNDCSAICQSGDVFRLNTERCKRKIDDGYMCRWLISAKIRVTLNSCQCLRFLGVNGFTV